jgi:hypothetical protein
LGFSADGGVQFTQPGRSEIERFAALKGKPSVGMDGRVADCLVAVWRVAVADFSILGRDQRDFGLRISSDGKLCSGRTYPLVGEYRWRALLTYLKTALSSARSKAGKRGFKSWNRVHVFGKEDCLAWVS